MQQAYKFLLRLPKPLMKRIKQHAAKEMKTINLFIREILEEYLQNRHRVP